MSHSVNRVSNRSLLKIVKLDIFNYIKSLALTPFLLADKDGGTFLYCIEYLDMGTQPNDNI